MTSPGPAAKPNLKLFVVYHNKLHPGLYVHLSDENLAKLTFYKVNEAIPYEFGLEPRTGTVVKEYEQPIYDGFYQANAFNETSCIIHVLQNRLYEGADYVGVMQYDMAVTDDHFRYWPILMERGVSIISEARWGLVQPRLLDLYYVDDAPFYGFPMAWVIERFCQHFGVTPQAFKARIAQRTAEGQHLSLLNSFIVKTEIFIELAGWLEAISKDLHAYSFAQPGHKRFLGHMGGIIERCIGLYFLWRVPDGERLQQLRVYHAIIPELHRTKFGQF
jgi:hypothetical protein